ncbi:MAG: hypothetical protein H0V47_00035 [Chloroflexia bacterium]|nr:hypothetical protein [Chloroflexia bacterium]
MTTTIRLFSYDAGAAAPFAKEAPGTRQEPQYPEMAMPMNARETNAFSKAT